MLDAIIRPYIAPSLDKLGEKVSAFNIPANVVTLAALVVGLIGCFFVAIQSYLFGLVFIIASRVLAGIDGAMARRESGGAEFGAYLAQVCDAVFYAAFVFFFVLASHAYYLAGLFLIFSYIGMAASSLAHGTPDGKTAPTLVGRSGMVLFTVLVCLFPAYFPALAFLFGIVCWLSAIMRVMQVWRELSVIERNYDEAEGIR